MTDNFDQKSDGERRVEQAIWATTKRVPKELDVPPATTEQFVENYTPIIRLILSRRGMRTQDLEDGVQEVLTYCLTPSDSDGLSVLTRYDQSRGSWRRYIIGMLYVRSSAAIDKYLGGVKIAPTCKACGSKLPSNLYCPKCEQIKTKHEIVRHYIKKERQFALDEDGVPQDVEDLNPDDPLGDILALDTAQEINTTLRSVDEVLATFQPTPTRDFRLLFAMMIEQGMREGKINATALAEPYGMACGAHRPFSRQAVSDQIEVLKMLPPMQRLKGLMFS